jgi:predicted ArsR family transcriptional regulator
MEPGELERQIAGLASLDEPVRRSLYFYVVSRQGDVGRDEAARAAGVSRTLAGFHLDRLAEEGLLETSFRRLSGRTGPGAGRPAKLYRRSARRLSVTLPERRYELAAALFAQALSEAPGSGAADALGKAARALGKRLGAEARRQAGARATVKRAWRSAEAVLAAHGFEPQHTGPGEIRLRNCPFDALTGDHRALVCGMNLALQRGMLEGLALSGVRAELEPRPGCCCVAFKKRGRTKKAG